MKMVLSATAMLLTLSLAQFAHADFALSAKAGAVNCEGDEVKVIISGDRKSISLHWAGDENGFQKYQVVNKSSDGDTEVSYTVQDKIFTVGLDDQGDYLWMSENSEKVDLKCK
jgi:hypothetical protein